MQSATHTAQTADHEASRLLLVEDNAADAHLVRSLLACHAQPHLELEHVTRLAEAKGCLDDGEYDIVLLDLGLPDSEGIDTLVSLLGHRSAGALVVLTGHDDADLRNRGMAIGADDWMDKDRLDAERLFRAVESALRRRRLERLLAEARREQGRTPRRVMEFILGAAEPTVVLSESRHILAVNHAAEDLLRGRASALVGRPLHVALGDDPEAGDEPGREAFRSARTQWQGKPAWLVSLGPRPDPVASSHLPRGVARLLRGRAATVDAGIRRAATEVSAALDALDKGKGLLERNRVPLDILREVVDRATATLRAAEHRLSTSAEVARAFVQEANERVGNHVVERHLVEDIVRRAVDDARARLPVGTKVEVRERARNRDLLHRDGHLLVRLLADVVVGIVARGEDYGLASCPIEVSAREEGEQTVFVVRVHGGSLDLVPSLAHDRHFGHAIHDDLLGDTRDIVLWLGGDVRIGKATTPDLEIEVVVP
jgi:DNA-binding response OmpR family regulator